MNITYKFLHNSILDELYDCWKRSFADYVVDMSYFTKERMFYRTLMDRVDYEYSVGAYDGDTMIGFLVLGIDDWKGKKYAFDAGTGIIKEYRGQGVAGKMFDHAVEKLKSENIDKVALEVIQSNEAAIKAYQKSGFEIAKNYNCYQLKTKEIGLTPTIPKEFNIRLISFEEYSKYTDLLDWEISWEYNESAIKHIEDEFIILGIEKQQRLIGFIAYYPRLHWIFQLAVGEDYKDQNIEKYLLSAILELMRDKTDLIKINNIPEAHQMNNKLMEFGFEEYIKQFEMEKTL